VVAWRARDGRVLAKAASGFPVDVRGDRRTVSFDRIAAAQDRALEQVLAALPAHARMTGMGIAATASTVAVVDRAGRPIADGLLWADHRAGAEAAAMRVAGHPNLVRMLGHVSPEWGIAKLARLAAEGALDVPAADRVVELADWLAWRLTGAWVANAGTREWGWAGGDGGAVPAALLEAAGVAGRYAARVLEDVRRTGELLGEVSTGAWRRTALFGTPVFVGGMDSYLAAVGMGTGVGGRLCLSVGSSSAVVGGADCGDATGHLFGPLRTVLPGTDTAWHGGQSTAGLAADWAARVLGASNRTLEREALASPPGSRGITFRETMLDRRTPEPRSPMTGSWVGLRLDHSRGDLYRAVLEGIAIGLGEACGSLAPRDVVATGGMLQSGVFHQALADVLARPVRRVGGVPSAAALGAAFADRPDAVGGFARTVSTRHPSGADYGGAIARYRAADLPPWDGGAA